MSTSEAAITALSALADALEVAASALEATTLALYTAWYAWLFDGRETRRLLGLDQRGAREYKAALETGGGEQALDGLGGREGGNKRGIWSLEAERCSWSSS